MIEETVRSYLLGKLDVPVYMGEEPKTKPSSYVVLQILDNGRVNHIDAVTFNILSYAGTLAEAAELNKSVKDAMYGITQLDNISSSRCGGGGQALNQTTRQRAYECVFNLYYMED